MDVYDEFFYCACEGSQSDLEKCLKGKEDLLKAVDHKGRTALMYAAIGDNIKTMPFLYKKGLNLRQKDNNGATALHWAVHCGSLRAAKFLIHAEPAPSGKQACLEPDKEDVTPIHIASGNCSEKMLRILLEVLEGEEISVRDKNGRTHLHYAACKASIECVRLILDNEVLRVVPDVKDHQQLTPLMCAAGINLEQSVDICTALIKRKPIAVSLRCRGGMTALHIAVAAGADRIVELLVEQPHVDVDEIDNDNRTPLHYAAEQGELEITAILLKHGAKNLKKDKYGATPAHYAAQFSSKCLELIHRNSIVTDLKDDKQRSCLMWAVCAGNISAIEFLITKTSTDRRDSEADRNGNTPMHLAAGRGHTDVVRFLVTAGAHMNELDVYSRTPVFWACFGGQAHTLYCMIKDMSFQYRSTKDKSVSRPIVDCMHRTPLHAAAYAGFAACINILLMIEQEDSSLDVSLVECADIDGETALHVASSRGKLDCVQVLVTGGSAINALDNRQRTPLMCAIENGHQNVAEWLKNEGALTYDDLCEVAATTILQTWRHLRTTKARAIRKWPDLPTLRKEIERERKERNIRGDRSKESFSFKTLPFVQ